MWILISTTTKELCSPENSDYCLQLQRLLLKISYYVVKNLINELFCDFLTFNRRIYYLNLGYPFLDYCSTHAGSGSLGSKPLMLSHVCCSPVVRVSGFIGLRSSLFSVYLLLSESEPKCPRINQSIFLDWSCIQCKSCHSDFLSWRINLL